MSRPWMPLYVADYLADTGHLTGAEHGAYLLLIMHYWANQGLPDDDDRLARIARMTDKQWVKSKPIIAEFFSPGWKHARIEFELTEAARISAAGRAGGVASGQSRRQRSGNDKRTTVERPLNDQTNDPATKREALQPPLQRKEEDTADAVSSPGKYAFESGVIRLSAKDFDQWKASFSHLDLSAELLALTEWAGHQDKWFYAVSGALAKRNREVKAKRDSAPKAANGGFV